MEERARVPVNLPHPTPTKSYWQDPPSSIANHRSTPTLPEHADYIIIGSGISGACIAHNILFRQPTANVLMLEARQACSGATGRNGGHTKAASYRSFLDHERELGLAEAVKIAGMEYANMRETHAFAREYGIDCASTECDTVDIVYSQNVWDLGLRAIRRIRETMGENDPAARYLIWDGKQAERKFLTKGAVGALQYAAGSLSAYEFATGVLNVALQRGLNLQTTTPAESIEQHTQYNVPSWKVQTPRGKTSTANLILATNGYTPRLLPKLQGLIVPLHGQVVAQRPGSQMPQKGLEYTYSLIYETGYEYMITRPPGSSQEGDIIIGGGLHQLPQDGATRYGNTDDCSLESTITAYLRQCTSDRFGANWGKDHPQGRVRKEWSGIMGASADGLPYVGTVPDSPGLWISASFNGHGMVWCLKAAQALVGVMMGNREEKVAIEHWFPNPAWLSRDRMGRQFMGRKDLRAPGEAEFGERSRQ